MNAITVAIENLKCNGCASTIQKGLLKFEEVERVNINIEKSLVEIIYDGDNADNYKVKLAQLGYPETGKNNTISVVKSFVSCAIGKVNQ